MAIGAPYIELSDLKEYLKIGSNKLGNDQALEDACSSASREVERICGRQFNVDDAATPRLFAPTTVRSRRIILDDLSTADDLLVEHDSTGFDDWLPVLAVDYELTPFNQVVDGVPGWPYTQIKFSPWTYLPRFYYPTKTAIFRVTGKWGWAAVPADVRQACMILAADTYQQKDSPYGIMSDQFGALLRPSGPTAGAGTQARAKLARYTKTPVMAA